MNDKQRTRLSLLFIKRANIRGLIHLACWQGDIAKLNAYRKRADKVRAEIETAYKQMEVKDGK